MTYRAYLWSLDVENQKISCHKNDDKKHLKKTQLVHTSSLTFGDPLEESAVILTVRWIIINTVYLFHWL